MRKEEAEREQQVHHQRQQQEYRPHIKYIVCQDTIPSMVAESLLLIFDCSEPGPSPDRSRGDRPAIGQGERWIARVALAQSGIGGATSQVQRETGPPALGRGLPPRASKLAKEQAHEHVLT